MCTYDLKYNDYFTNMTEGLCSMLATADIADVTLAIEGKFFKTHQMVLSIFSPYFRELFRSNPCKHPIFFMKDVKYQVMKDLLTFMYEGKVQIAEEEFNDFVETAKALKVKGLTNMAEPSMPPPSTPAPVEKQSSSKTSSILANQLTQGAYKEQSVLSPVLENKSSKRPLSSNTVSRHESNVQDTGKENAKKHKGISRMPYAANLSEVSVLPLPVASFKNDSTINAHEICKIAEPTSLLEIEIKDEDQINAINGNQTQEAVFAVEVMDSNDLMFAQDDTIELDEDADDSIINLQNDEDDVMETTGELTMEQMIGHEGDPVILTFCKSRSTQKVCGVIWDDFRYMLRKTYKSWSSWLCGTASSRKCRARLVLTCDRRIVLIDSHNHGKGRIKRNDCTDIQRTYYNLPLSTWKKTKGYYPSNRNS